MEIEVLSIAPVKTEFRFFKFLLLVSYFVVFAYLAWAMIYMRFYGILVMQIAGALIMIIALKKLRFKKLMYGVCVVYLGAHIFISLIATNGVQATKKIREHQRQALETLAISEGKKSQEQK